MDVQYSHNCSSFIDIYKHLKAVSPFFFPPLEGRVDIEEYANKLFTYAEREEVYYNEELTGFIAYYYTEGEKEAFISNVSVLPDFKNKGIASSLLRKVKLFLRNKGVYKISMEVTNNSSIIDFYRKSGFDLDKEIDNTKFMMVSYLNDQTPLVSILCLVYNHRNFIRKCLDGFVMQQTNFPIEILIHDDASTDGSAEIIREYEKKYPMLFKPIYQSINQYSKGIPVSHTYQYPRCSGKYIATCEGDDYWKDPLKLQKQIAFLEEHPDYGLSHTEADMLWQETQKTDQAINRRAGIVNETRDSGRQLCEAILIGKYVVRTPSVVMRKGLCMEALKKDPFLFSPHFLMGDTPLWLELSRMCNFHYLPESTVAYRRNFGSVSRQTDLKKQLRFRLSGAELRMYFSSKYKLSPEIARQIKHYYATSLFLYSIFCPDYQPMFDSVQQDRIYRLILRSAFLRRLSRTGVHLFRRLLNLN